VFSLLVSIEERLPTDQCPWVHTAAWYNCKSSLHGCLWDHYRSGRSATGL